MNQLPSEVGAKAYALRWGTWRKTLAEAFVKRVNSDSPEMTPTPEIKIKRSSTNIKTKRGPRDIPLSLRYKVLVRDNFRCKICGQSPAKDIATSLHVDHLYPWSKGGPTSLENLRTLCSDCNLGKGNKIEE